MNYLNSEDKRLIIEAIIIGIMEVAFIAYMTYLIFQQKKKL
jgi:hypothetical protein